MHACMYLCDDEDGLCKASQGDVKAKEQFKQLKLPKQIRSDKGYHLQLFDANQNAENPNRSSRIPDKPIQQVIKLFTMLI